MAGLRQNSARFSTLPSWVGGRIGPLQRHHPIKGGLTCAGLSWAFSSKNSVSNKAAVAQVRTTHAASGTDLALACLSRFVRLGEGVECPVPLQHRQQHAGTRGLLKAEPKLYSDHHCGMLHHSRPNHLSFARYLLVLETSCIAEPSSGQSSDFVHELESSRSRRTRYITAIQETNTRGRGRSSPLSST